MASRRSASRRKATTRKILDDKASDRRYEQAARAGRKEKALKSRADLIKSMLIQAERELKGIDCGKANANVIRNKMVIIQKKMKRLEEEPTDENIFDAACELCCKNEKTCKGECKNKLRQKFPTTKELIEKEKKSKKVYESVFSDEDDLQLKF
tara:strand:+ start:143 stop:601 length:459 start_codon:yes stop_codon:yes gene_type:complete